MAIRLCEFCGGSLEGRRGNARFDTEACRKAFKRRPAAAVASAPPAEPASTDVADALLKELTVLGLAETYEAAIAIKTARQLDNGTIVGTAFTSLSKELDRRVDALRLKAERPDDPVRAIRDSVADKQSHLRAV